MKKKRIIWSVIALLVTVLTVGIIWENTSVGLTTYTVTEDNLPASFDGFRIAHISDLHNSWLWEKAIAQLKIAQPDIIVITGDMVDWVRTDVDEALNFAREAVQIASCFYVTGNHEGKMPQQYCDQLLTGLKELGVMVLQDSQVSLHRGGSYIVIAGDQWGGTPDFAALTDYDGYKILLTHQPEEFLNIAAADFDLAFTGHVHGGQIRIPFIGGIYGPNQGLFPKYDSGIYSLENTDMIVSRGIGNSSFPIRVNNQPEVILVILESE